MILRDYQKKDVGSIREAFTEHNDVLYVLPTGGGKTIVFCYITENAIKKNNSVCILVHRQELVYQASMALKNLQIEHSIIAPLHFERHSYINDNANVAIASVQTLVRRLELLKKYNLLIIDECHHQAAGSWVKIKNAFNGKTLGVTATPKRLDGKGLKNFFSVMIKGKSTKWLIENNYLSPIKIFAPTTLPNLTNVRKKYGEFILSEAQKEIDKPTITGDAIAQYKKHCDRKPAIAYCCSVDHAEHTAESFRHAGYRAICLEGNTKKDVRHNAIADLASGNLDVITNCEIITEGVDVPVVTAAIMLRPTKSLSLYLQMVGRVLRKADNKDHAYILDHVGNVFTHGLPTLEHNWQLEYTKEKKKDISLSVSHCKVCFAIYMKSDKCPYCGHIQEKKLAELPQIVKGELVEIKPEWAEGHDIKNEPLRNILWRAKTYDQLVEIQKARGYKPGWVFHRMQYVNKTR